MKNIKHFYSLNPDWQQQYAKKIGAEVIDNKIIVIPETLGVGHIYFKEVSSGISALLRDFTLTSTMRTNKLVTQEEFYIFQYNPESYEDANYKKDLSIFSNQVEDIYEPIVNQRTFDFSLFIEKKVMQNLINEMPYSEVFNKKLNTTTGYHYDLIDSKSLLMLFSLKKKSIFDVMFDCYVKGISYKLLANFLEKNTSLSTIEERMLH